LSGRIFLLIDHLWHIKLGGREVGESLKQYFIMLPDFLLAFGYILQGMPRADKEQTVGCGAVFLIRKNF